MESTPAPRHCRCSRFRSMRNWALWRTTSSSAPRDCPDWQASEAPASRRSRECSEIFRWSRLSARRYPRLPWRTPIRPCRHPVAAAMIAASLGLVGSAGIDGHGLRRHGLRPCPCRYDRAIAGHPFAAAATAAAVCERCLDPAAVMLESGPVLRRRRPARLQTQPFAE